MRLVEVPLDGGVFECPVMAAAIKWTRLSCRTFPANLVRLQLHALAYNLGNFLRTLATPEPIKDRALTSLRKKLIKSAPRSSATVATSPSGWPRSLSPSKCSRRYCGSSRNCGRTHRLRQHKTAVSHAFSSNRRKDCVQMPSRTTSSDTQPHLGRLGMAAAADHATGLPPGSENTYHPPQLGVHLANPSLFRRALIDVISCSSCRCRGAPDGL